MLKQSKKRIGSNSDAKELVTSKIEVTKSRKKSKVKEKVSSSDGLVEYRLDIGRMEKEVVKFALTLSKNLLSIKMALMNGVRRVEDMMRERKE